MPEKFDKLPLGKQKKILDACINEFADRSYNEASTNRIVKNARHIKRTSFSLFWQQGKACPIFAKLFYQKNFGHYKEIYA